MLNVLFKAINIPNAVEISSVHIVERHGDMMMTCCVAVAVRLKNFNLHTKLYSPRSHIHEMRTHTHYLALRTDDTTLVSCSLFKSSACNMISVILITNTK